MTNRDFRQDAREAVARARAQLVNGDERLLRYVALDLRMAMEALTYDRAQAFKAELPPEEYDTWQPKKLMQVLLEIEPLADTDSTLRMGEEAMPGQQAAAMHLLGTERVFNLKALKTHYDALGSFLHMPTLRQLSTGRGTDLTKLRTRCDQIIDAVEAALASRVRNITLGRFSSFKCEGCGKMMRKRLPASGEEIEVRCFEEGCSAAYLLSQPEAGKAEWAALQQDLKCLGQGCGSSIPMWSRQITRGAHWNCPQCNTPHEIGYMVFVRPTIED